MSDRQVIDLLDRVTGDITSTPGTVPGGASSPDVTRSRRSVTCWSLMVCLSW